MGLHISSFILHTNSEIDFLFNRLSPKANFLALASLIFSMEKQIKKQLSKMTTMTAKCWDKVYILAYNSDHQGIKSGQEWALRELSAELQLKR